MIFLVKTLGPQEQMQVSKGAMNFDRFVVRCVCWNAGDRRVDQPGCLPSASR
jgi:hypothetical protein